MGGLYQQSDSICCQVFEKRERYRVRKNWFAVGTEKIRTRKTMFLQVYESLKIYVSLYRWIDAQQHYFVGRFIKINYFLSFMNEQFGGKDECLSIYPSIVTLQFCHNTTLSCSLLLFKSYGNVTTHNILYSKLFFPVKF